MYIPFTTRVDIVITVEVTVAVTVVGAGPIADAKRLLIFVWCSRND